MKTVAHNKLVYKSDKVKDSYENESLTEETVTNSLT